MFRPVHSTADVRQAAAAQRRQLLRVLLDGRTAGGWLPRSLKPEEKPQERGLDTVDVWTSSQAIWAVLHMPDASNDEVRPFLPGLEAPFAEHVAIEANGVKYGWRPRPGWPNTIALPALETASALARALGRPGLLSDAERRRVEAHFAYTQEVLKVYRPLETGGWNVFPNQLDLAIHEPYTTTIALMALLEARAAGLPWEGSRERRDALLKATAQWLIAHYDADANPPGWHGIDQSAYDILDGLTLQLYAVLLRAEEEAGIQLPAAMLEQIPRRLASCAGRGLDFPTSSGEFSADITDHEGKRLKVKEQVRLLWHPWAIDAAARWLKHAEQHGGAPEDDFRVRRALGHLVIDLGDDAVRRAGQDWTFLAAELLYGLDSVAPE
jgi:hypothetical protein